MPQSKPIAATQMALDSRSRAYMIGHQMLSKKELQQALAEAMVDPDLRGNLRTLVIERYKIRLSGGSF